MKKAISLLLALVLCLSLCACGKSAKAKTVDEMILAIGEVTNDNISDVETAMEAYDALPEQDKKTIENYALLQTAQEKMFYIKYYDLTNRLLEVYNNCQKVTNDTVIIWDNVGSNGFWNAYEAVRFLSLGLSREEYDKLSIEISGAKAYATIWCAARGLCPDNIYDTNKMTDEGQDKTIELCHSFNKCYDFISQQMEPLSEEFKAFKNKYKEDYRDETDTLSDLCLELSMYVDFALEPTGSLTSYTSKNREYIDSIDRLAKIIDSYR